MGQQILHFLTLPIFFFLFMVLYKPFGLESSMSFPRAGFAFNVSIITAIIFVILVITRLILWGLRGVAAFKKRTYFLWCLGEITVSSLFISLYLVLISGRNYSFIDVAPVVIVELSAVLVYPYVALALLLQSDILAKYNFTAGEAQDTRLRFYDDKHNLKFIIEISSLLYVEASDNYCNLFYTEGNKIKSYLLRSPLKAVEETCAGAGIVRCHRSYMVNAKRIKVLRKDHEGFIRAEMDVAGVESVPVTRRYYESIYDLI